MTENSLRPRYPSDLTERQWECVSPLIPASTGLGRPRAHPLRDVIDAINYRWETGCVWRMLPHDFPPWPTVYTYYRAWQRAGVLRQLREVMVRRDPERSTAGKSPPTDASRTPPDWPAAGRCNPLSAPANEAIAALSDAGDQVS